MGLSPKRVSVKMFIACVLLTLFGNVSFANECPPEFIYNSSYELCTHTIIGNPESNTVYCIAVNLAAQVQVIDGVEMCTVEEEDNQKGGGFGGGLPPPPGRR